MNLTEEEKEFFELRKEVHNHNVFLERNIEKLKIYIESNNEDGFINELTSVLLSMEKELSCGKKAFNSSSVMFN